MHIAMKDLRFHPSAVTIRVGQKLEWTNTESVDHNVTADSGAHFHSRAFGEGRTFSFRPTRRGTIRYECTLHPGMRGTIAVR